VHPIVLQRSDKMRLVNPSPVTWLVHPSSSGSSLHHTRCFDGVQNASEQALFLDAMIEENLVSAEEIESTLKRSFNNMQVSG